MGYLYSSNLLNLFFSKLSPSTEKAYRQDLNHFKNYLTLSSIDDAVDMLIGLPQTRADLLVMHYKAEMSRQELQISTINRRVSTLRSLVKEAKRLKLIPWSLEVTNDKSETPIKPSVLTPEQVQQVMTSAKNQSHLLKARRDHAIIRLIFDLALKREIVSKLPLDALDLQKRTLLTDLCDKTDPTIKKLAAPTLRALLDWLEVRSDKPGPLFTQLDTPKNTAGLSSTSIYRIVRDAGLRCGIKATPDTIRQAAIFRLMEQAEALGIDERDILNFSDHQSLAALKRYRSKKLSMQEKLTKLVSKFD